MRSTEANTKKRRPLKLKYNLDYKFIFHVCVCLKLKPYTNRINNTKKKIGDTLKENF